MNPRRVATLLAVILGGVAQAQGGIEFGKFGVGASGVFSTHATVTPGSLTNNFLDVIGTMPTSPASNSYGSVFQCTGAGSSGNGQQGCTLHYFVGGYTGARSTFSAYGLNASAGTAASPFSASGDTTALGNIGFFGQVTASTGTGWLQGVYGLSTNSGGGPSTGVTGMSDGGGNSIGGLFGALGGTTRVGAWIGLRTTTPTFVAGALQLDNGAQALPILTAQDNSTTLLQIQDAGSLWASQATKTLTESAATTFVRVAVASGARTGGTVFYCINAADASDHQERCGNVPFAVVNKAGTETCALGTAADVVAVSVGTLTVSFTADTATPSNGCDLQANAVSSLTQTTLNMSYFVQLSGIAASAVTPQ